MSYRGPATDLSPPVCLKTADHRRPHHRQPQITAGHIVLDVDSA